MRFVSLAATLFIFWLLLSGHFDPFLVVSGALAAIGAALIGQRMSLVDREGHPIELMPASLLYWPWLAKEIVKSGLAVTRIILDPALPVAPRLVRLKPSQRTAVGTVTYANSITLTPGTITVEVNRHDRAFVVHALTADTAEELERGEMDRRITAFEGRR